MNEGRKNIKQYTSEDIRKYLEGSLTPAEMHAMEKAALDDPFLADAIEGIQQRPDAFKADVAELEQRMNKRLNRKPNRFVISIFWKSAAAAVVLTATVVTFFILINGKAPREEKVLAKTEERFDSIIKAEEKGPDTIAPKPAPPPASARQRSSAQATIVENEQHEIPDSPAPETILLETEKIVTAAPAEKQFDISDSIAKPTAGNYNKVDRELQGKAAGVIIDSKAKLSEVVVVGYSAKKKQSKAFSGEAVEARNSLQIVPEGGWIEFDNYLYTNTVKDSLSAGSEIISFSIDKNGRPIDYKIRKSLSPAHDAEAIRLLDNGPNWKIASGKKKKVRLEIIF